MGSTRKVFEGVAWGVVLNIVNAIYGFVAVPLLLAYFGKSNYGIIALASSVNVYLSLMDMGLATTNTRFFSNWLVQKDFDKLGKLFQSSIVFYSVIGVINALVLLIVAYNAATFFNVSPSETEILKDLLYILAITASFNWVSSVYRQLIYATENVGWAQKASLIPKLLLILILGSTLYFSFSIAVFFLLNSLSMLILLPIFIYKIKTLIPQISFVPKYYHKVFKTIIPVSLSLFSFSIFSFTANNIGPLMLGIRSNMEEVADYRIIQTISGVILLISSVFSQSLLPVASKITAMDDRQRINLLAEKSTKYIVIVLIIPILMMILSLKQLLSLYLGEHYVYLVPWVSIGLVNIFFTHTSGIASLVLNSSKLNKVIVMTVISMIISVISSWYFCLNFGAGGAILSLFIYSFLQTAYSYLYFYPRYLKINSKKIFTNSVCKPASLLSIPAIFIWIIMLQLDIKSNLLELIFNSSSYLLIAMPTIWFLILDKDDKEILKKVIKHD